FALWSTSPATTATGPCPPRPLPPPRRACRSGSSPKVLKPLVSAGVLVSLRGPHGGYRLAKPAAGVNLLDVVGAVDGAVRGEVPRWEAGAGGELDDRLQAVVDATAEAVRGQVRKVTVADLACGEG